MDTKDKKLQEAIGELCQATIKILRLTNGNIPDELKLYGMMSKIREAIGLMDDQGESMPVPAPAPKPEPQTAPTSTAPQAPQEENIKVRYAYRAYDNGEGDICWDYVDDQADGNAFKLYIHNDNNSVEFEVIAKKMSDMLDEWEMERETYNPSVVSIEGEPSDQATLQSTARGKGIYNSSIDTVTIVEPCKAKFV